MAKQLTEILMESGILDAEQVKRVQLFSKQNNVTVAEAIVKFGFATEEQVTAALSKHFAVPYASRENGILVFANLWIDRVCCCNCFHATQGHQGRACLSADLQRHWCG